jgi:metal-responsive CopG/Arc/MetJ family transcriptional regulator
MKRNIRTTIALPEELLEATDQAVSDGKARSRNELIASALRHELAALDRLEIDEAFEGMSDDQDYREQAVKTAREFASADWEALQQGESLN